MKKLIFILFISLTGLLTTSCDQLDFIKGIGNKISEKGKQFLKQGQFEKVTEEFVKPPGADGEQCIPKAQVVVNDPPGTPEHQLPPVNPPNLTPGIESMFSDYSNNPKVRDSIAVAKQNVHVCKRNSRIAATCNNNCVNGYCEKDTTKSMGQCSLFFVHSLCANKYPFLKSKGASCPNGISSKRMGMISGGRQGDNLKAAGWMELTSMPGFKEMNLTRNDAPAGAVVTYLDESPEGKRRAANGDYVAKHGHVDLVGDNKFYSDFTTNRGSRFSIPLKGIYINPELVTDTDLAKWPPAAQEYFKQKMKR